MIEIEQVRTVAQDLLRQTRARHVRWWYDPGHETGRVLYFPTTRVRIIGSDANEPVQRRLLLEDEDFNPVGEWIVHPNEEGWELLRELYESASNTQPSANNSANVTPLRASERVLKEIQTALRGTEKIGT